MFFFQVIKNLLYRPGKIMQSYSLVFTLCFLHFFMQLRDSKFSSVFFPRFFIKDGRIASIVSLSIPLHYILLLDFIGAL